METGAGLARFGSGAGADESQPEARANSRTDTRKRIRIASTGLHVGGLTIAGFYRPVADRTTPRVSAKSSVDADQHANAHQEQIAPPIALGTTRRQRAHAAPVLRHPCDAHRQHTRHL